MIGYRFNIIIKGMFKPDHVAIGVADILNLPCMGKLVFPSLIHERAWMPVQFQFVQIGLDIIREPANQCS